MFFELEFEPDGHRCVLKQTVVQNWMNDMYLHQTEWLGRALYDCKSDPDAKVIPTM